MRLLDVVATKQAFPEERLGVGQVGTVVEQLEDDNVLVEFADLNGVAYAITPLRVESLLKLRYSPAGNEKPEELC